VTAPDTDNGRVTLAVLGTKLDSVLTKLDEMERCQRVDHDRIGKIESEAEDNRREVTRNAKRIEQLDTRSKTWDGLNTFAAVVAGVLAGVWGNTP